MTTIPGAMPLTDTDTLFVPAGITTVGGTAALPGSLDLMFTVNPPAGAGPPKSRTSFPDAPTSITKGLPEKLIKRGNGASISAVWGSMLSA